MSSVTRRRFLQITALACAAPLACLAGDGGGGLYRWRGIVLGADAGMQIYLPEPGKAEALVQSCLTEIRQLERIFSLHDPSSHLSQLNRQGYLDAPPSELVELLLTARDMSVFSQGAFDVTVQPLWHLYSAHFSTPGAAPEGPSETKIRQALQRVGYHKLSIAPERITLSPGTQITLNGIAQGYITDRVTAVLKAHGITRTLVEMGEMRALGAHPDGPAWPVGIRDPLHLNVTAATVPLADRALATSGGYGTRFDASGRLHHLLDPASGRSVNHYASVSVLAADATTADALSTALFVLPSDTAIPLVRARNDLSALFILADGTRRKVNL